MREAGFVCAFSFFRKWCRLRYWRHRFSGSSGGAF